jgi:hypothetical protein
VRISTFSSCLALLVIAGAVAREASAGNLLCPCPCPCPPGYAPSGGTAGGVSGGTAGTEQGENAPDVGNLGSTQNGYMGGNNVAAGAGATSVAGGGDSLQGVSFNGVSKGVNSYFGVPNSLILSGLLTAANAESALPQNRVFFQYSYYDQFQVVTTTPTTVFGPPPDRFPSQTFTSSQQAGFNLNRFDVGFEKTICGGEGSIYGRVPILYAEDNVTTADINGVGDISVGIKYILLQNNCNGDTLTAGVTLAAPTAEPGTLVYSQSYSFANNPNGQPQPPVTGTINPVFLQPWVGGVVTRDRWTFQEFFGVLLPLDDRFVSSINNDFTVGYNWWQSDCEEDRITSITPTFGVQVLAPLGNGGSPTPVSYPTQIFLTEGCQFGIGKRISLFGGIVEPISNNPGFHIGATGGVNLAF